MQQTILITNYHPDGFAFALNEAGEQIFTAQLQEKAKI